MLALTYHHFGEQFPFIVFAVLALAVLIRLIAGSLDRERIRKYVEDRGGTILEIRWDPFGPGWFGSRNERIYAVSYRDCDGNTHDAHCKTSLWSGVYFTDD